MYVLTTIMTLATVPRATANFEAYPWAWGVVRLERAGNRQYPASHVSETAGYAFVSSVRHDRGFVFLFGIALYPNLITSNPAPTTA